MSQQADSVEAEQRRALALRQHELLVALVAGGAVPAGFDATRVRAQAAALVAKRRSVEARAHRCRHDSHDRQEGAN